MQNIYFYWYLFLINSLELNKKKYMQYFTAIYLNERNHFKTGQCLSVFYLHAYWIQFYNKRTWFYRNKSNVTRIKVRQSGGRIKNNFSNKSGKGSFNKNIWINEMCLWLLVDYSLSSFKSNCSGDTLKTRIILFFNNFQERYFIKFPFFIK